MKNILLIILALFTTNQLLAQDNTSFPPISISYWGGFGYQPGVKIGTEITLKNWETSHENKSGNLTKTKSYFISPQIGFYSWPRKHMNFLVNAEAGYRRIKSRKNNFSAISVGLGYLLESRVTSVLYNLNDGSIQKKNRANSNFFLPTVNYEFGKMVNSNFTWFSKISLGAKLSTNRENSTVAFFETGVKYSF